VKDRLSRLIYFLLIALEALGGLIYLLSRPSDPENQWIAGFSLPRLAMLFLFSGFAAAGFFAAWKAWRERAWGSVSWQKVQQCPACLALLDGATLLFLSLLLTPSYRYGTFQNYFLASLPVLLFFLAILLQAEFFFFLPYRFPWQTIRKRLASRQDVLKRMARIWLVLVSLGIFIGWSGVGVRGKFNWYEAGIPLLTAQVWYSLLGVLSGYFLLKKIHVEFKWLSGAALDWLIAGTIWFVAAVLWIRAPLAPNFFAPGPYPPAYAYYPYSDAATWDVGGQFALIGQGIANRNPYADHAGLMGLLAILHLLMGQSFERLLVAYVAIFAVFPVLFYFLGKHTHSRLLGIFLALLAIVHELNAIAAGTFLNLSHVKLLMTEFPTGVGLLLVALLLMRWLSQPASNQAYALPLGGILAWLILVRFSTLFLPLVVFAILFLAFGRNWKGAIRASLLVFLATLLVLSPWMWRSWRIDGNPFFFAPKASLIFRSTFRSGPPVTPTPAPEATPTSQSQSVLNQATIFPLEFFAAKANSLIARPAWQQTLWNIFNHFVHNLVTSVLILPVQPFFHDLRHSIYTVSPFWDKLNGEWRGALTWWEALGLALNLAILSIGLLTAWKKHKIAGVVPLFLFLSYNLATAISRTSGGRYLVPAIWVVLFYYGVGIIQLLQWLFSLSGSLVLTFPQNNNLSPAFSYRKGFLSTLPALLFVITMVAFDFVVPQRYPKLSDGQVLTYAIQHGYFAGTTMNTADLRTFLQKNPKRQALIGRVLYPRFYDLNQGELAWTQDENSVRPFPRITFTLIGPQGEFGVSLPQRKPPAEFPNAIDAIVFGCPHVPAANEKGRLSPYYDALVVILLTDHGPVMYSRQPDAPLACPLPEPVCTSRKDCK
jgi:hypothetical protein